MAQGMGLFQKLCFTAYHWAPGVAAMRTDRSHRNWADRVLILAQREELQPCRRVLEELATNGLATVEPLTRFAEEEARRIPFKSYQAVSRIGEEETQTNPCAGFVLTWVALVGWGSASGDHLYGQIDGMPNYGWVAIPHAYASVALRLGDLDGPRGLVDKSYNILRAAKFPDHPDLQSALRKYRALALKIYQRFECAIGNLADDLHRSAGPTPPNFRAEIMALLWTLGFVPECQSMRLSDYVPSRSFLKKIIWLSLERLRSDPLTQYVWLEMKDKPPFNLRDHRPLFDEMNVRYVQYHPDEMWEIAPSQIYAQSLIAWLRGEITSDQVDRYLAVMEEVRQYEETRHYVDTADWSIYLRMISLAYVLARQFDRFQDDVSEENELATWHSLWSQATRMRRRYSLLNPHRPDLSGTLNYPLFHFAEHELATGMSTEPTAAAQADRVIQELEQYRAAALSHALLVAPPLVGAMEENALGDLLSKERELLQWIRGALFLIHYEFLPEHFRRYATDMGAFIGADPKQSLNLDTGRKEYEQSSQTLNTLFEEMKRTAPEYAARRLDPCANVDRIVKALRSHSPDAL